MDFQATSLDTQQETEQQTGVTALSVMLAASQFPDISTEDAQRSFVQQLVSRAGEAEASNLALILLEALGAARASSIAVEAMGRLDQAALSASAPVA